MALFVKFIKVNDKNVKVTEHSIIKPKADTQIFVACLPVLATPKPIIFYSGFFIRQFIVFTVIAFFAARQLLNCIVPVVNINGNF